MGRKWTVKKQNPNKYVIQIITYAMRVKKCALRVRSWQPNIIVWSGKRAALMYSSRGHCTWKTLASPDINQADWDQKALQERGKHTHWHENRKHFGKHKPLQEVLMRAA